MITASICSDQEVPDWLRLAAEEYAQQMNLPPPTVPTAAEAATIQTTAESDSAENPSQQ
jgi:hypothetical protein